MQDKGPVDQKVNPFVFVVGCPRSGTTLLQRMLDSHPELTVANDTHFITRAAKRELRGDPRPPLTPELLEAVLAYRRFHRMGLEDSEVRQAASNCDDYATFVSRLYSLRGRKNHKRLSGEKTPDFCRQMPALHALFPEARFVHIIRDGRNTALSTLNWATASKGPGKWDLWEEDPVGTCALWWRWQAGSGQRDGGCIGPRYYLQLRYEDLVEQPAKILRMIASFLGIPDSEDMVNYHQGKTRHEAGLSAKSAWLPPVANLRDWRSDMPLEDAEVFEGIAGNLLQENDYPRLEKPPARRVTVRVNRCLSWWQSGRRS